jgi:hypothetical protein
MNKPYLYGRHHTRAGQVCITNNEEYLKTSDDVWQPHGTEEEVIEDACRALRQKPTATNEFAQTCAQSILEYYDLDV